MKKLCFCLLLSVLFVVTGCGGRKTENEPETAGDSDKTANDTGISADYDEAADDGDITETETDGNIDEDGIPDPDQISDDDAADEDSSPDEGNPVDHDETTDDADRECDLENGVSFVKQPDRMNIAPKGRSVSLSCEAEAQGCAVTYQWYESTKDPADSGTAVPDATNPTFETPVFTKRGIRYYYCTATAFSPSGESRTYVSKTASVAYTTLPTLYLNTPGSIDITSKEEWIKNADISIVGADDENWNFNSIRTSIRGRGNASWLKPKKPYNLKLKEAAEIMGMPAHKRWVLLSNYCDSSFMRNIAAFYFSELFELDWTPHGEFVDLVLNGKYNGLYWLGEAIKVDKNRVDINDGNPEITDDEDKDYLIEMDLYFDEILKFKSEVRDLPYMIKNDDYMVDENDEITTGGESRLERLQAGINALEKLLYPDFNAVSDTNDCSAPDESYSEIIDIDSWVKFWFVNEVMNNNDAGRPRSDFFTFDSTNNIFKAGPVWDFDIAASSRSASCQLDKTIYYNALFKSPRFVARTKELWNKYYSRIDIEPRIGKIQNIIAVAAKYDAMLWEGKHDHTNTLLNNDELETFEEYVEFLQGNIRQKISVVNTYIENLSATETNP